MVRPLPMPHGASADCVPTDLLLHVEPSNMQAQSLKALIDQAETREGYIGEHTGKARIATSLQRTDIGLFA